MAAKVGVLLSRIACGSPLRWLSGAAYDYRIRPQVGPESPSLEIQVQVERGMLFPCELQGGSLLLQS